MAEYVAYREEVTLFAGWCRDNNLVLNIDFLGHQLLWRMLRTRSSCGMWQIPFPAHYTQLKAHLNILILFEGTMDSV